MNNKNQILNILKNIKPECDFQNSSNYINDGYLDSFDIIMIIAEIDQFYQISILGEDIIPENFSSIENLYKLVLKYLDLKSSSL